MTVELLNKHLFYDLVFTDVTVNDAMRAVVQAMRFFDVIVVDILWAQNLVGPPIISPGN